MERSSATTSGLTRFGAYWAVLLAFGATAAVWPHGQASARSADTQKPRAAVAGQCTSGKEQSISAVLALREHMVMLAVKCGRTEDYETFSRRFLPALQANETSVTAWFARKYGAGGAAQKDRYTSELVDIASRDALGQGEEYCFSAANRLINGLDAQKSGDDLARFVAANDPAPANMSLCDWAARNP
jgi:hypothetical protein